MNYLILFIQSLYSILTGFIIDLNEEKNFISKYVDRLLYQKVCIFLPYFWLLTQFLKLDMVVSDWLAWSRDPRRLSHWLKVLTGPQSEFV